MKKIVAVLASVCMTMSLVHAQGCAPAPSGLVGEWKGDGNAFDSIAANNGVNQNVTYSNGVVGQAFAFDPENFSYGTYSGIQVADQPAYALTNSLTIEGWIRPRGDGYIIFWRGDHRPGLDPYTLSMEANNTLEFAICDAVGNSAFVNTTANYSTWTHVAAVLDGSAGTLSIYTNGVLAVQTNTTVRPFGTLQSDQSPGVGIGNLNDGGNNFPFLGDIDEISLYNRALSTNEIMAIYNAGSAGKCTSVLVTCDPPPSGLVSWWPAEGNANDNIGTNNGILENGAGFSTGEAGNAFNLNGANNYVLINASPSLNVGVKNGLTIEGWINPTSVANLLPIAEFERVLGSFNGSDVGVQFWVTAGNGPGCLYANLVDTNGVSYVMASPPGLVTAGVWQHVALSYDKASGVAALSLNGSIVTQTNLGSFTPQTSYYLLLGARTTFGSTTSPRNAFSGGMDEVSIYNRALTSNEVAAIYNAGSLGKCFTPLAPFIVTQPLSQTNLVGTAASFSVTAGGTAPLSYQWSFKGTNIAGATNTILTLNNVQLTNAGNYSVTVTNIAGSTNSAVAVLTVNLPATCNSPALTNGLVAYYPFNGNANDASGNGHNGTIYGGVALAPDRFGNNNSAYLFNGTNGYIDIGQPVGSAPTNLTETAWVKILKRNSTGQNWDPIMSQRISVGSSWPTLGVWASGANAGKVDLIVDTPGYADHILSITAIPTNQWCLVCGVKSNGVYQVYMNGVLENTVADGAAISSLDDLCLMRNVSGVNAYTYCNGALNDVRIYNRALSSAEVAQLYCYESSLPAPLAPFITQQPVSQTNIVGSMVNLTVTASGTAPLGYQWKWNGTNISNATNTVLTLSNVQLTNAGNYSVTVSNLVGATNSTVAVLTVALPPLITRQPQSQSVLSYNSASFTVAATGTGPLNYHWRKGGTNLVDGGNISGSTTTSLHLASVSLGDAGNYDVVVGNSYATTNSAVAVLTVPQTMFTVASTNAMSGSTVVVPVLMNALGVEYAFQASVSYDPTKLFLQSVKRGQATAGASSLQTNANNNGYVGFAISLNNNATMPVGTNEEVADLVFQVLAVTNNTTVNLTFGDNPMPRQTADNNLNSLPAIYQNGIVTVVPAEYAADVFPRTNGDHQVGFFDWLEVGRMVAGLDVPTNSDEFLRADCAPRGAPDGVLTVADWVQAGRYESGLDPLTLVTLSPPSPSLHPMPLGGPAPTRILQVGSVTAQRGQTVNVPVQLVCTTNENALGLTVAYDVNRLTLLNVTLGSDTVGGQINVNTTRTAGEVGVVLAMSPGTALAAGTNQVAVLQFAAAANASGTAALTLDDSVVKLQLADTSAGALAASYVNGGVILPPQPTVSTVKSGANLQLTWQISTGTFSVQSADSPAGPWADAALPVITNGASATVTVNPTNQQQYFRLIGQ